MLKLLFVCLSIELKQLTFSGYNHYYFHFSASSARWQSPKCSKTALAKR